MTLASSSDSFQPAPHRAAFALNGYDPRFRRLLHAIKTALAVVLTTVLLSYADLQTRLFGSIAAAFLMQCVGAGSHRYQRNSMILTALIMAALVFIGAGLSFSRPAQYAVLIAVAWGTPEVRRRMPDHNAFALFCFTMAVLATELPGGWPRGWREAAAVGLGRVVSDSCYFWIAYQPWFPKPSEPPTNRTAWRAGLAALLSVLIAMAFGLPRAYWAIMTSVFIVAETWKESRQKALQRVGMTAAGCIVAWGLHFLTAGMIHAEELLMFLFVFLAVFFRNASYLWMTFCITLYVAFLFAVLGEWTLGILITRLYKTAIGCGTSLLAALLIGYSHPATERNDARSSGTT